ncbi:zinc finger, PMZ-type containing protein [Tanacetum coccineum]
MKLPRPRTALPVSSDLVGQELALLVPNGFEKVYYCKSGAKLTSIRELKSDKDIVDMLKVGYDNGFQIDKGHVEFGVNEKTPQVDPDDNQIDPVYKLKVALENYGVAHGYQLWYMKNDWRQVLVYCGRNIDEGRCAGKKGNKHRVLPRKVRTRLFRGDEGNQASRTLAMNKLAFSLEDTITPSIRKRLEILKEKQREWVVYPSGFQELEVRKGDQSYGVSLQHKVCQCRLWELSGIPCVHAVAAYMHVGTDLDAGVSHWYSREAWFNAYQFSIKPVFGTNMWKMTNDVPPLPPIIRKMPGRPQKKRIPAPDPQPKPEVEKKSLGRNKQVFVGQCASRGGGRSGRGDGNDGSGSGSGVNDASGSGVNAGMFIPSYTMLKVKQYILLESMLFWLEYQLDFIFYMNKHLGNLWKNKAKRQLNSAEQESWDKERREERNRKKE